tara:strand:- start:318 stop:686 length:369 start_codon:yes stop_codon:yes gene_type:complete
MKRVKANLEFVVNDWDDVSEDGAWVVTCNEFTAKANVITIQQGKPNTTYVRNTRRRRRANGMCSTCGDVPQEGYVRCQRCREYSISTVEKRKSREEKDRADGDVDINYIYNKDEDSLYGDDE